VEIIPPPPPPTPNLPFIDTCNMKAITTVSRDYNSVSDSAIPCGTAEPSTANQSQPFNAQPQLEDKCHTD